MDIQSGILQTPGLTKEGECDSVGKTRPIGAVETAIAVIEEERRRTIIGSRSSNCTDDDDDTCQDFEVHHETVEKRDDLRRVIVHHCQDNDRCHTNNLASHDILIRVEVEHLHKSE